jgi:hypothetical protein
LNKQHNFFHQSQRQFSVLHAVNGQTFPGVCSTFEKFEDFCVMDVFFLIIEDLIGYVVQTVRRKFMFTVHVDQHVQLDTTVDIDLLGVPVSHDF